MSGNARRVAALESIWLESVRQYQGEWIGALSDDDRVFLTRVATNGHHLTNGRNLPQHERRRYLDLIEDMRLFMASRIRKA